MMTNIGIADIEVKKVEQYLANVNVLAELARSNPRNDVLKSYKGFGGLKQCFNSKQLYGMLMREIRRNFGQEREHEVFHTLRQSCKSAYYTPPEVIKFMYRYLAEVCNFKGGDILEPACGSGTFFEHMPNDIKDNSNITGIEMDILTSKLVQKIYPDVDVINQAIQDVEFSGKKYDLIIGNPPYGSEVVNDEHMPDVVGYTIHHYFIAKCIRLLKDDGILAFVLPAYFMDIPRGSIREIIDREAVLIDAVRLPDNLFEQAKVTVDVLIFRRSGTKLHNFVETVEFVHSCFKDYINQYWQDRPHRVLGELKLKWIEAYQRYVPTCTAQNTQKVLKCLANCKFDQATKDNFNKIANKLPTTDILSVPSKLQQLKNQLLALTNTNLSNIPEGIERLVALTNELIAES